MAGDLDAGIALVGELVQRDQLASYHLVHATHADLLRRRGELAGARADGVAAGVGQIGSGSVPPGSLSSVAHR